MLKRDAQVTVRHREVRFSLERLLKRWNSLIVPLQLNVAASKKNIASQGARADCNHSLKTLTGSVDVPPKIPVTA